MAFPADFSAESRQLDTSRYVYHYTSRDSALQHILSGRKIRLGSLLKTNDPRETKSWTFSIAGSAVLPDSPIERKTEIDKLKQIFEAAKGIRGKCKVLCTSMDDPTYDQTFQALAFHEFKRGFGHSRMWA
jgi:hypothetical protein